MLGPWPSNEFILDESVLGAAGEGPEERWERIAAEHMDSESARADVAEAAAKPFDSGRPQGARAAGDKRALVGKLGREALKRLCLESFPARAFENANQLGEAMYEKLNPNDRRKAEDAHERLDDLISTVVREHTAPWFEGPLSDTKKRQLQRDAAELERDVQKRRARSADRIGKSVFPLLGSTE